MLHLLPNFLSLCMLALGFASLSATLEGAHDWALRYFIFASLLDGLAGSLAWRLNQRTDLGRELDDLANLASLSICPLIFAYESSLYRLGNLGLWACCIAAAGSAIRLSKNNQETPEKTEYRGLPLPVFGLGLSLAVGLNFPPQALVLLIIAALFVMFNSWGYLKAPSQIGTLLALAIVLFWSGFNENPLLLAVLFCFVLLYCAFGHLRFFKRLWFLESSYPGKAASA